MKFHPSPGKGRPIVAIDVTALVDVVFLLLIFLLVTTTFRKEEHAFEIDLVESQGAKQHITSDKTTVYIDKAGHLYLLALPTRARAEATKGERIDTESLTMRLKQIHQDDPDSQIAVRGAQSASLQRVVDVLNLIEEAGFKDVALPYEQPVRDD